MKLFTEIYKPKSLKEIYGQDFAILKLKDFVLNFKKQKKKAAIIYGPTGTGKTVAIYSLANDFNLEILELNASDYRNSDKIDQIIKPAIKQKSLFHKGKLILIDEIDGISTNEDIGGIQAITTLIQETTFPIIITANDPWSQKFSPIRKESNLIEFKSIDYLTISKALSSICSKNDIKCSQENLKKIAIKSNGDLRAAITDLQTLSENKNLISDTGLEVISDRNKKITIFNALRLIFKNKNVNEILNAFNNTDIDLDEAFLWLEENLPIEYSGDDLIQAYDALSKADVFRGRIRKRQYYRFLLYQNNLMTVGIALAKKNSYDTFMNYRRNTRILKYWLAKNKYQRRKDISIRISKLLHSSSKRVIKHTLPYLSIMLKKKKNLEIGKQLDLSDDDISYLITK